MNIVILRGRLVRDPETRNSNGMAICDFSVAVDSGYGENKYTNYIDCTAFKKTAELISEHMTKGKEILLEGNLRHERWESDGQKRSKVKVTVNRFEFIGGKEETTPDEDDMPF